MFDTYQKLGDGRPDFQNMKPEEMQKFLAVNGLDKPGGGIDPAEQMQLLDERMRYKQQQIESNKAYAKLSDEKKAAAMKKMWTTARNEIGTHGEFNALNAALLARPDGGKRLTEADLPSFLLHNTYARAKDSDHPPGTMPRCHHCATLTSGVSPTAALTHADQHRSQPERR